MTSRQKTTMPPSSYDHHSQLFWLSVLVYPIPRSLIIIILLLPLLGISYSMTSRLRHDTAIFDQSALFQVDELEMAIALIIILYIMQRKYHLSRATIVGLREEWIFYISRKPLLSQERALSSSHLHHFRSVALPPFMCK
jgi:hypothetical protein